MRVILSIVYKITLSGTDATSAATRQGFLKRHFNAETAEETTGFENSIPIRAYRVEPVCGAVLPFADSGSRLLIPVIARIITA
jgi:hypothetical protein